MRAALYARVSTKDKGQDVGVQLLALRRYVQAMGWEISGEYTDHCTGKTPKRDGLGKLLDDAQQGKFDVVLVLRIDRIMRSVRHFISLNDQLALYRVKLVSAADGMDYATPIGKLVRGVLMDVAEFEVEQLTQRTLEGLEKARADGKRLGRPVVEIDVDKAIDLLQQPGMSKAKVASMLGTNRATLNNRLRESGVVIPTPDPKTKGIEENEARVIYSGPSNQGDSKRTIVSASKGRKGGRP
ncbi:MAG TPA: recombinase family protein [Methanomassiliicoccales archaeon]